MKKRKKKPASIAIGPLKASPRRPPTATQPDWYWQVYYYEDRKPISIPGGSRRGNPTEITEHLIQLAAGGYRQKKAAPLPSELTIDQLCRLWLKEQKERMERGRQAASSYSAQKNIWKQHIAPRIGAIIANRITRTDVQRWVDDQDDEGIAPRTVANRHRQLRQIWKWGRSRGLIDDRELHRPELPLVEGYTNNHVTPSLKEAEEALSNFKGWKRVLGELLLVTGARVGEVCELKWAAWDREGRALTLTGKTGPRTIPTVSTTHRLLLEWWMSEGQPHTGRMFRNIQDPRNAFYQAIRHHGFTAHGLRRLASTRLIGAGVDPAAYEALMGHSFSMGLKVYAEAEPARLAAAASLLAGGEK